MGQNPRSGKDCNVKIDNSVKAVGTATTPSRPKTTASTATPPPAADLVQLSPRLQEVDSVLANAPVVNASRVTEIKQAIAEGRFQVNPERIASGLLDSVRQMLSSRR
jgi:negative regulator of flagellin synthesis FlgM